MHEPLAASCLAHGQETWSEVLSLSLGAAARASSVPCRSRGSGRRRDHAAGTQAVDEPWARRSALWARLGAAATGVAAVARMRIASRLARARWTRACARITRQLGAASRLYATVGLRRPSDPGSPELGLATGHWSGSPVPPAAMAAHDPRRVPLVASPCHVSPGTAPVCGSLGLMNARSSTRRSPELRLLWFPDRLGERHPRRCRTSLLAPMACAAARRDPGRVRPTRGAALGGGQLPAATALLLAEVAAAAIAPSRASRRSLAELAAFGASVAAGPPFPDLAEALAPPRPAVSAWRW